MIVDAHAHAWRQWPYDGPDMPCSVDALLRNIDQHRVDRALLIAARIGAERGDAATNDDNNAYLAKATAAHPDRLALAVEIDGHWSAEYGSPGAVDRLGRWMDEAPVSAVALYPSVHPDGWLETGAGAEVLAHAAEKGLLVSLAASPARTREVCAVARRYPWLPILIHHLGLPHLDPSGADPVDTFLASYAEHANIYLKLSGLHYAAAPGQRFPFTDVQAQIVRPLIELVGPARVVWGSDFPAYRQRCSYGEALEVHSLAPLSRQARAMVAGQTLADLLAGTPPEQPPARPSSAESARR